MTQKVENVGGIAEELTQVLLPLFFTTIQGTLLPVSFLLGGCTFGRYGGRGKGMHE